LKTLLKYFFKILYHGFALLGIASLVFGLFYAKKLMTDHNLTPRQFVVKAAKKMGVAPDLVQSAVAPAQRFQTHRLTGPIKASHPRTLFRSRDQVKMLRNRYRDDPDFRKIVNAYTKGATRWLCAMDFDEGENAISRLLEMELMLPKAEGEYGNGFDIALMYDFLYFHPEWTPDKRNRVNSKIRRSLEQALMVLDGGSASMWHGRFQLAAANWVVASVLDPADDEDRELVARSQAHFLEAVKAISITGGWPEGYNYWINNRAYSYAMACISHMNSVEDLRINADIQKTLETVGLWTLYGTRPDGMFHLFGDTGPRNDLKDETQRVIDLIFHATNDPVYRKYSEYIDHLHGAEGYYRAYRWEIPVFRGLDDMGFSSREKRNDLSFAEATLNPSRMFGKDHFGQAFIRSGWGEQDTFISFRAGDTFTHHGHYKAGHFTIFKHAPLAISSGTYGGYTSAHRLNYYIRTVASNSILILSPDECQKPNKFFDACVAAGGQRIVIPTGSAIAGVDAFMDHVGKGERYQGGDILVFENSHPEYVYIKSDLTGAYSPKKAASVMRELVYLKKSDVLVVHDLVESTRKDDTKKWLLHAWSKPATNSETVVKGTESNGILETFDKRSVIVNDGGKLLVEAVLPENCLTRKIGGPDFNYYVETDGDDGDLDGENMGYGAKEKPWFDAGLWRMEVQPEDAAKNSEFLIILKPHGAEDEPEFTYTTLKEKDATQVHIDGVSLIFSKDPQKPILFANRN
jgi:hypothetical protein